MSPTLLAHLRRIERQTRLDVIAARADGQSRTRVTDFYRAAELTRMFSWCRPMRTARGVVV